MPGQATAYKVGELKIRQIRERKEKDAYFDLKSFHEHVLNCLGPIDMLEQCIDEEENLAKPPKPPTTPAKPPTTTSRTTTSTSKTTFYTSNTESHARANFWMLILVLTLICLKL